MVKCIYNKENWLIYSQMENSYILLKQIDRQPFGIQYFRTIVNKKEVKKTT